MMKSNRVISSADADFCLCEMENPNNDDDDNNSNLNDIRKQGIFEQEEAQLQRKGENSIPQPLFIFIYDII